MQSQQVSTAKRAVGVLKYKRWPMHIIMPVAVAVAVGGLLVVSTGRSLRPAAEVHVLPVVFTQSVPIESESENEPRRRTKTVQAPGWLEADPFYVACTALADGVVAQMLVLEGEHVEKGQIVARLVEDDAALALARAEADLATGRALLGASEAERAAAQTDWDNPVERERAVGVWSASLAETEAELAQLPSLIEADRAVLERLREEHARAMKAFESGASNDFEVLVFLKEVEAQAAVVESQDRRGAILDARRDRLRAEVAAAQRNAELRVAERLALDAAEAHLLAGGADVVRLEARRDEAKLRLDRMTIFAPINGYVQRRLKVPGDKVIFGMDSVHSAHLLHLYDPEQIQVRVDVPLADAANVYEGQPCEIVVEVLPDETFKGEVTRVTHEADLQKNTLQVKVRVIDPSPLFRPEMLTRVKFIGDAGSSSGSGNEPDQHPIVRVPESSMDGGRVWVIRDRRGEYGTSMPVTVTVVSAEDGWASVRGDLRPGDLLAIEVDDLSAGDHVKILGGST